MRILAIAGKVDSRILAYTLARALSLSGLTALIADDGSYRRLYFGDEDQGTVSGVDISVGLKSGKDLRNSLNDSGVPYDNIILVTTGYIPIDVTGVIICKGIDRSIFSVNDNDDTDKVDRESNGIKKPAQDSIDIPDSVKSITVYISFETPPKKMDAAISLRDTAIKYIYSCEEKKELQVLEDKGMNKLLAQIASEPLGIVKEELFKLLMRPEYTNSNKVK